LGNPERDETQLSTFICDISAYFHKIHKFQGQNTLREEDRNIPTLTHVYLNHIRFHGYLFNQIVFIISNTPNLFI